MSRKLKGQKFGRLTVIDKLHNYHKNNRIYWLCVCECGNLINVNSSQLVSGQTQSCGCLRKDLLTQRNIKHDKCNTRLYNIWGCMKQRCYNKNQPQYKNYGGRGIAVCDKWRDDFMVFYDWAMTNGYKSNLTIDRIDNNKGYEPSNCRWVTRKQQNRNTRQNRNITINGETHCLKDWCKILGLKRSTVSNRINQYNWSIKQALELEGK